MNYILPEDFDFYSELKKENEKVEECHKEEQLDEPCLISGEALIPTSSIKLDCGHNFNYVPLLNSIQEEKHNMNVNSYYYYSSTYLREHQLRCPYCRQIQEKILPYYPELHKKRIRGVNYPTSLSMGTNECNHVFKSGKNKGACCGKKCYREKCQTHYKAEIKLNEIKCNLNVLSKLTLPELRKLAKHYKLKKYSTLKKKDLINLLVTNSK